MEKDYAIVTYVSYNGIKEKNSIDVAENFIEWVERFYKNQGLDPIPDASINKTHGATVIFAQVYRTNDEYEVIHEVTRLRKRLQSESKTVYDHSVFMAWNITDNGNLPNSPYYLASQVFYAMNDKVRLSNRVLSKWRVI